jgi:hypothetical protein
MYFVNVYHMSLLTIVPVLKCVYRLDPVLMQAMLSKTITFSSLTTPGIFQTSIEGSVEKRQGRWAGHTWRTCTAACL